MRITPMIPSGGCPTWARSWVGSTCRMAPSTLTSMCMTRKTILSMLLVDASAWIALFNPRDDRYWQARAFWTRLARERAQLLTSYYILDESYTLLRRKASLKEVVALHNTVTSSAVLTI